MKHPDEDIFEYERQREEAAYYARMEAAAEAYDSWIDSLCHNCMSEREDWHNKLCGDGLCATCSMNADLEKEGHGIS